MSLVDRAKNVVLHPAAEWPVIAAEPASPGSLFSGYVAPLALIAPVATFVGLTVIGVSVPFIGTIRVPFATGLTQAILSFVFALVGVFLVASIVNALAPTFSGEKNLVQALKVTAYSYTPGFVAGILLIFPPLGILAIFAAFYGLYLLYTGLPIVMKSPKEKAPAYALSVVACAIVVGLIFGAATAAVRFSSYAMGPNVGSTAMGDETGKAIAAQMVGNALGGSARSRHDAEQLVNSVASAGADAERAEKSGDATAQAAAGANVLKALVTGGKNVSVVPRQSLKALLPDSLAGMARGDAQSEGSTFAGISGSKASALYKGSGEERLQLEIGDMGNMGGLTALAGAAASMTSTENDRGYEKNVEVDGRNVHESWRNSGKHSELFTVVNNRFAVGVTGDGVDMDAALKALGSIDYGKLAGLAK